MSELLQAAKAVIDNWACVSHARLGYYVEELSDAVERAEKQEAVGFDEWFPTSGWNPECVEYILEVWQAAQQAERERCREIVITMGGPDVPELLKQIDSGEE